MRPSVVLIVAPAAALGRRPCNAEARLFTDATLARIVESCFPDFLLVRTQPALHRLRQLIVTAIGHCRTPSLDRIIKRDAQMVHPPQGSPPRVLRPAPHYQDRTTRPP